MNDRLGWCSWCEEPYPEDAVESHEHLKEREAEKIFLGITYRCDLCKTQVGKSREQLDDHFRRVHLLPSPTPTR